MPVAVQRMTSSAALAPNEGNEIGEETSAQKNSLSDWLAGFFLFFCVFLLARGGDLASS